MISPEHASRVQTRFVLPRQRHRTRTRHQIRSVQWVQQSPQNTQKVFIQTNNRKFLTVRYGAVVGAELDEHNRREFLFDLVPARAAYASKYARFRTKVVLCCKLRWKSYWLKTSVGSDGDFEIELTQDDADDHTTVFKRRLKSDGRYGTGFECLLFKNVYLQYYPKTNEVDVKPYNPRIDIGATLKSIPVSTLFHVVREPFGMRSDSSLSVETTTPRFSANIDQFEDEERQGCCGGCFGFFKRKSSPSDTSGSVATEPTFPSNDTSSRMDVDR
ncbi:uncharacterized protein [Argopecten irradians]|uniref:uncharacterized protein n=1 Tax=Argopecten irradians TaxID=31199 RepID=UPI003720009C